MTQDDIAAISADPPRAKARLERLLEANPAAADKIERLAPLHGMLAGSEYLCGWLAARPGELDWLLADGVLDLPRTREEMIANLASLMAIHPPAKALRYFKHRELMRVCARELSGSASLEDVLAEWTAVADTAIHSAATLAYEDMRAVHGDPLYTDLGGGEFKIASFAVIGMGKLGGGELNISSDVDLVYVHSSDRGSTTGPEKIHIHQFFARVAHGVTRLLGEVTEDGFVFRVDLDLRPEGESGEVTNSIGAMEVYYESYGRQWERQALIKARHCGGDPAVANEVIRRLQPFVYRKYMDENALKDIADLKSKIDQSQFRKKTAKNTADDVKLGKGGIREVEFTVQALQLLKGGRDKTLRVRATLKTLDALFALGLLSVPHHTDLKDAYIFLRRLENRIQYDHNTQTQIIPADPEKRTILARLMGFSGDRAAAELMEETGRRRARVREIFELFTLVNKEKAAEFPAPLEDQEAIAKWLDSLMFDHPTATARALLALRDGADFSHPSEKSQRAFARFGPALVAQAAATPWPDQSILGFLNFVEAKKGRDQLYEMLDAHRPVIELLARMFSASESLAASLVRQPDILDRLLVADPVGKPPRRATYKAEFARAMASGPADTGLGLVNSFRIAESVRLGLRMILGMSGRGELREGLTMLAEEYLAAAARMALALMPPRPPGAAWSLVAAGKLGRREMNFGSDLDLIAFFDHRGTDSSQEACAHWVTGLVQEIIRLCGARTGYGSGYQVDMRLRPEGESAPLVSSLSAARVYYVQRAGGWEKLALVGARPIAGDAELSPPIEAMLAGFVEAKSQNAIEGIIAVRERMARERPRKGTLDIKFGEGGLVDVEFICQWLRIEKRHIVKEPVPFTMAILEEARRRRWLEPDVARTLINGYELLRAVEDAIRMNREQALHSIPLGDTALIRRLARAVETDSGPERFLYHLKAVMAQVRGVFDGFFQARLGEV
jgi:glutamate-ammonia-ligase adenylyltransferase